MRLLIDARSVRTPSGLYIFHGLASHWRSDPRTTALIAAVRHDFDCRLVPDGVHIERLPPGGWLSHLAAISRLAKTHEPDVIFSPNATAPADPRVVLFFQDLHHFAMPEGVSLRLRASEFARGVWRRMTSQHSLLAVAVSEHLARQVRLNVRLPAVVIPHGIEVGGADWRGSGSHVLVLGGIGGRKSEACALKSWAAIPPSNRFGASLEIIGVEPAERRADLLALCAALECGSSVSIAPTIPREQVLERMATCVLAISCTTFESFGLPVAEALVIGAPVACTDIPAHRELISRAGAGALFPCRDTGILTQIIRQALGGAGPPRSRPERGEWGWASRAREHLDAYARAIAGRRQENVWH